MPLSTYPLPRRYLNLAIMAYCTLIVLFVAPFSTHGQPSITPTVPAESLVYAEAIDWLNVRYGPGTDYPRVGIISKGQQYRVLRTNADRTWLEIAYSDFIGGRGWVYRTGVVLTSTLDDIPIATDPTADYPALTATPPMVVTSAPLLDSTPNSPLSNRLETLSQAIYDYLLGRGFNPSSDRLGSVFLMDLQTGERYSLNPNVAYSGMSLIKLPILVSFYRHLTDLPTYEQAEWLALMIVCSENLSTNQLLSVLGDGDPYRGAAYVTQTMQSLGLRATFLAAPLVTDQTNAILAPTVPPIVIPPSTADQSLTSPDPFNQTTPADLGWLLAGLYQCALDGSGSLTSTFPTELTTQKCRAILRILRADDIPAMLHAGIPSDVQLARKHGWVDEVHGDAGLFFTLGGDYVLVVMLRDKTWLDYDASFPTIAEISRMTYNAFNPADPLSETHTESVPLCSLGSIDPHLFNDLHSGTLPPLP